MIDWQIIAGLIVWSIGCFGMGIGFVRIYDSIQEEKLRDKLRFSREANQSFQENVRGSVSVRGTYIPPLNSLPPPRPNRK